MKSVGPSYQRFVNGVPVTSISRRSFRLREKYLIVSVLLTFAVVWLGALFYLPEFRSSSSVNESVYNVYKRIQNVGPELLMPPPLARDDIGNMPAIGVIRHEDQIDDPHIAEDRKRLQAKIEEDMGMKVLERPQFQNSPSPSKEFKKDSDKSWKAPVLDGVMPPPRFNEEKSDQVYKPIALRKYVDPDVKDKLETIKKMMQHAWAGYRAHAWGQNEVRPVSRRAHPDSVFGPGALGASIVDGLDTLYIMGLHDDFKEGRDWIANNLNFTKYDYSVSVFETTIRFVGGLLSCYSFTGDEMFRTKAAEVADALLPAFNTPTGLPYSLINPRTQATQQFRWSHASNSILSEVGTLHLEFKYLSEVTGNDVYRQKVEHIRSVLLNANKPAGFYYNYIDPNTGNWGLNEVSLGALGDSFYEYLLKAWLVSGREDVQARSMFDDAMRPLLARLVQISKSGFAYLADMRNGHVGDKMQHLACFAGGMFALAAHTLENALAEQYWRAARNVTRTCRESYARADTGLGPEVFSFSEAVEARAMKRDDKKYLLRPETFESYFIMWRLTKDQKYRDWGWDAVQALEKYCRSVGGYSGIKNVYLPNPQKDDVQQSYFLAESLKYLYLLFADDTLLPLDEWVFNTEAHPLPIKGKNNLYRGNEKLYGAKNSASNIANEDDKLQILENN